jgi:hypothetical protein
VFELLGRGLQRLSRRTQAAHPAQAGINPPLLDLNGACSLVWPHCIPLQVGTPHYMAPEMWRRQPYSYSAGGRYTWRTAVWLLGACLHACLPARPPACPPASSPTPPACLHADIWALGCVLHELCTLKPLFIGGSDAGVRQKVRCRKAQAEGVRGCHHSIVIGLAQSGPRAGLSAADRPLLMRPPGLLLCLVCPALPCPAGAVGLGAAPAPHATRKICGAWWLPCSRPRPAGPPSTTSCSPRR